MVTINICGPGPTRVIKEEREEPRWCFSERKRVGGTHQLLTEVEPSYYDPWWRYVCDGCGGDYRLGFGRVWVEADY